MRELVRRQWPLLLALACSLALLAGLWPELRIGRHDLNDHSFHGPIIERMAEAMGDGESPLDCWMGDWSLGHAVPRTYQPLPHLAVAAAWLLTGRGVDLETLFIVVRTLLLAAWPLTAFLAARLLRLDRATCAAVALVAPLVATDALYGLELGSHAWRGSGLYTQLWGMHALALAFALGVRAIRWGRSCTLAALALAITFGCHLVYGQVGAISLVVVALLPAPEAAWRARTLRLATTGLLSVALSAWQLVPLLRDDAIVNRSRWEHAWKWDSFGLQRAGELLWSGELLDFGRVPVLTLLAAAGVVVAVLARGAQEAGATKRMLIVLAGAWLLLLAGRPAWGPLLPLLGFTEGVPLHRLIGGAHLFLIFAAGIGLASLASLAGRRAPAAARPVIGAVVVIAALVLPWRERAEWLRLNREWGERNLAAHEAELPALSLLLDQARTLGGRTYPGLAATWGRTFRIGDVPVYSHVSEGRLPAVAFLYHSMSPAGEVMVQFDETSPAEHRVFGVRSVLADRAQALPPFLKPVAEAGRFRLLEAPGGGFFDVVHVGARASCTRRTLHDVSLPWLRSDWPARGLALALDWEGAGGVFPPGLPEIDPARLPEVAAGPAGRVHDEERRGETYEAVVEAAQAAHVVFKMSWSPRWRVQVDGAAVPAFPVAPGFLAAPVPAGRHAVRCDYVAGSDKRDLLALVPVALVAGLLLAAAGMRTKLEARLDRVSLPSPSPEARERLVTAGVLLAACLPFLTQVLRGDLTLGHDHLSYLPRVVEMHENVRHGIVLPRWAPDLGSGHGQPLFVFAPPGLYWLAELFVLAGANVAWAMNLAVGVIVLASAVAAYRMAEPRLGVAGARLAAVAYVLVPYFSVELFVRHALAELAAFPLYPLILDGLLRHDATGRRRWLAQSALAFAALLCTHPPAALLLAPVPPLLAIVLAVPKRRWGQLLRQAAALGTGLLLAGFAWLPALLETGHVKVHRLLEHASLRWENHFVTARQLLASAWGHGLSVAGSGDGMSFELGRVHLLLAIVALVAVRRRKDLAPLKPLLMLFACVIVTASFLMTEAARPVWASIRTLQFVQFEWRLLVVTALPLAFLAGAFATVAHGWRHRGAAVALAAVALVAVNLPHVSASGRQAVDLQALRPEEIARRAIGVTTADEYEPAVVQASQPWDPERMPASPGIEVLAQEHGPEHAVARVRASAAGEVWLRTSAYPGWTLLLDGVVAEHRVAAPSGFLIADVPPGEHEVRFELRRTAAQRAGLALSLSGIALLAGLVLVRRGA